MKRYCSSWLLTVTVGDGPAVASYRVENPGDTELLPNEVVDKYRFRQANDSIAKMGKIKNPGDSGIETTEEEWQGYRIIVAIGSELVDPERIAIRDAKSYCAILLDDNNRRPICRLHFGKTKRSVTLFVPEQEQRVEIERVQELYRHKADVLAAIGQYLQPSAEGLPDSP